MDDWDGVFLEMLMVQQLVVQLIGDCWFIDFFFVKEFIYCCDGFSFSGDVIEEFGVLVSVIICCSDFRFVRISFVSVDDWDDVNVICVGEVEVMLVMGGYSYDGICFVVCQYIVISLYWNFGIIDRVSCFDFEGYFGFFVIGGLLFNFGFFFDFIEVGFKGWLGFIGDDFLGQG